MGAFGARGPGDAGGDVHSTYRHALAASSPCAAVVSGHGHAVAALREKLRKLMQQYLGTHSQGELMRDLNQAVREQRDNVTC